ncbi:HD-GYP domain-containing protein [Methylobrevis pamukkalensis]|uniref:Cyclic di-GMP phosphodiesterase response regulator RpfG n=1 Tax=Methylobrevis pamukkalensis TaxID=1439726 RepID=A0A1E3H5N5_9HYPH|nr:HD domain-containing phosphohydrolase [Methylobrevis pamukkalensis]ODN71465.1 Cyclic di-GMP phosphodiesterase response regulator RpfG [Methylobrevis pamukkalensis]
MIGKITYPVLVDIDLHNRHHVETLRRELPKRSRADALIFAVHSDDRAAIVQAKILGGTFLVRKPLKIDEVRFCLDSRPKAADPPANGVPVAMSATAAVLDHAMSALRTGVPLDITPVAKTAQQLVSAIAEVGIDAWLNAVRNHHEGTFQHCMLVTGVATAYGHGTALPPPEVVKLATAGLLHDIGKASITTDILDKPGRLTDVEYAIIKRHPTEGYEFLRAHSLVGKDVLAAVRDHHEFLDGSGYPAGLTRAEIAPLTRILTVCDIYAAMIEERSYKPPMPPQQAIEVLKSMARSGKVEDRIVDGLSRTIGV